MPCPGTLPYDPTLQVSKLKTHMLDAIYFELQQRFMHYVFGGELEEISEAFAKKVMILENA